MTYSNTVGIKDDRLYTGLLFFNILVKGCFLNISVAKAIFQKLRTVRMPKMD